MKYFGLKANSP